MTTLDEADGTQDKEQCDDNRFDSKVEELVIQFSSMDIIGVRFALCERCNKNIRCNI